MKTEFFLAIRYLFRGNARHVSFISIVSCLGVMVGVGALIVVISVMNGFDRDLMEKLLRFDYHITIESADKEIPADMLEYIRSVNGVVSTSAFVQTQVFAQLNEYVIPLAVRGIDFENAYEGDFFSRYILSDTQQGGFFIGKPLYDRFLLNGTLEYYPLKKSLKLKEEKIRGVFKVGLYDIDNGFIVTDIERAKELSDNYLLYVGVRLNDPFAVDSVRKRLAPFVKGMYVTTWIESNQVLFSALQLEKFVMFVILSLIVLVASFNIFATLTVKVVEKTKDIGVLKSLGFHSRKVLSIFSIQGILLGSIGVFLGVSLGVFLCVLLEKYHFIHIPQQIYYIEYLPVALNVKDISIIAFLGIVLSFLSSLFPAIRASRLDPSEALRYE